MHLSLFDFESYRDFLAAVAARDRGRRGRGWNLQVWAKRLGLKSPRSVAMVLKGQRLPSQQMVEAFSRDLKLSELERRYFHLLVLLERTKARGRDFTEIVENLRKLRPASAPRASISLEAFVYVSGWHFVVLKQLIERPGFREDAAWIRKKLKGKLTEAEIRAGIETMLKLGILAREGDALVVRQGAIVTSADVPSAAIRSHHSQMLDRAKEALQNDVTKREFGAMTFRMDPSRVLEAKEAIRQFRAEFEKKFAAPEAGRSEVFQFNQQLFSHSEEKV